MSKEGMRQEIPSYSQIVLVHRAAKMLHWNEELECSFSELHDLFPICHLEQMNEDREKEKN